MTNLQIAEKLREQIKAEWPYVSTILALYANNQDGRFTERIQSMIDRLLPTEVYYIIVTNKFEEAILLSNIEQIVEVSEIKSLPINQVLFSSEDNMFGHLK